MAKLRANARWTVPGNSGVIAAGWKVNTYIAGTVEAKNTYTDASEVTPNTNPVILDSRGEATIYWAGTYKVVVTDEDDVTVWTEDNYGTGEVGDAADTFNKVANGSFELDSFTTGQPDDWTVVDYATGNHTLNSADQYSGLKSLKFTSVGSGGGYATSAYFEVEEGKRISFVWAMRSSVADVRNVVDVLWATSAKAAISTINLYDDSTTNPTSWTAKNAYKTPPSTARYAQIRVYGCHSSDVTPGSTWYDNIVVAAGLVLATAPNTFTAIQTWSKGADVAAATALTLGSDGNYFDITGTTTITSIASKGIGTVIKLHFDAIATLTHHATNLVLPASANISTYAGYEAEFIEYATGDWRWIGGLPEEGSWTPILVDANLNPSEGQSYSLQYGLYTRIGNRVFINGLLGMSSLGTLSGSSQVFISGLPFTSDSNSGNFGSVVMGSANFLNLSAGFCVTGTIAPNTAYIRANLWDVTTGDSDLTITELSADGNMTFSGQYVI